MNRLGLLLLLCICAGCSKPATGVVAMLTDYGSRDHYVGVISGAVLRANPNARIVTLTHEVTPFNVAEGAYLANEIGRELPPGAVLLGIVDPGVGTARAPVAIRAKNGLVLVGPDNGLFDPLLEACGGGEAFRIENPALIRAGEHSSTFHGRDLFAPIAGYLSAGGAIERVGSRMSGWERLAVPQPVRDGDLLRGAVAHVDVYGNVQANIPADWLGEITEGARLKVRVGKRVEQIPWRKTYASANVGELLALKNAAGKIELAINRGSAAVRLGGAAGPVEAGAPVEISLTRSDED